MPIISGNVADTCSRLNCILNLYTDWVKTARKRSPVGNEAQEVFTQPGKRRLNSITVCRPIVMMLRLSS